MRTARRDEGAREARRQQLGLPEHVTLAPETQVDRLRASAVDFGAGEARHRQAWKHDRQRIASSSIFGGSAAAATGKKRGAPGAHPALTHKRRIDPGLRLKLSDPGR